MTARGQGVAVWATSTTSDFARRSAAHATRLVAEAQLRQTGQALGWKMPPKGALAKLQELRRSRLAGSMDDDAAWVERQGQADMLRELFFFPLRPVVISPSWLRWNDGLVHRLASVIYEGRSWEELPFLADALLEAGCDDEQLLEHCKSGREHSLGCVALDTLLGKG